MSEFISGFVSIVGRPNVGKSTLLNCFIGEKIAIVSNKPQTTRNKIQAILTRENYCQIIFIDTPGIHQPTTKLGKRMVKSAESSMNDVDLILFLVPPHKISPADLAIIENLKKRRAPVILVINKCDTINKPDVLGVIDSYKDIFDFKGIVPISALKSDNTDTLLAEILKILPKGPQYFPADMITDQPERRIAAELIREKILFFMEDEIPHGTAVEINLMKPREGKDLIDIDANIYCVKDSHKGMIIGKNGEMLKKIGRAARVDIERVLGSPIYLQLWVKVKKDWKDNDFLLDSFGFKN